MLLLMMVIMIMMMRMTQASTQMLPFFDDFDKLRSGFCAPKVFTRVLCSLGLENLAGELLDLAELYRSDQHKDKWVNYKAFITEMETPASSVRAVLQVIVCSFRTEQTSWSDRRLPRCVKTEDCGMKARLVWNIDGIHTSDLHQSRLS